MGQRVDRQSTMAAPLVQIVVENGSPDPTWARDAARWLGECRPWVRLVVVEDRRDIVLDDRGTPTLTYEPSFLCAPRRRQPGWVLYHLDPDAHQKLGSHFIGGGPDDLATALTEAQSWLSVLHLQADAESLLQRHAEESGPTA